MKLELVAKVMGRAYTVVRMFVLIAHRLKGGTPNIQPPRCIITPHQDAALAQPRDQKLVSV